MSKDLNKAYWVRQCLRSTDTRYYTLTWLLGMGRWSYQPAMVGAMSKGNSVNVLANLKQRTEEETLSFQGKFLECTDSFKCLQSLELQNSRFQTDLCVCYLPRGGKLRKSISISL